MNDALLKSAILYIVAMFLMVLGIGMFVNSCIARDKALLKAKYIEATKVAKEKMKCQNAKIVRLGKTAFKVQGCGKHSIWRYLPAPSSSSSYDSYWQEDK